MGLLFKVIAAQSMWTTLPKSYWYQYTQFKKEILYMSAPLDAFYIPLGVSWSPYLAPLGPPCFFLGTPLGLPGSSPSRVFCIFALSTSVCMFSSHCENIIKRIGIWVLGGAPVALPVGSVHPDAFLVFHISSENIKCKKSWKTQVFKDSYWYRDAGVPPGGSFFDHWNFGKHTFSKKGPNLKNVKIQDTNTF